MFAEANYLQRSFARHFGRHSFRQMLHWRFWQAASRQPSGGHKFSKLLPLPWTDIRRSKVVEHALNLGPAETVALGDLHPQADHFGTRFRRTPAASNR